MPSSNIPTFNAFRTDLKSIVTGDLKHQPFLGLLLSQALLPPPLLLQPEHEWGAERALLVLKSLWFWKKNTLRAAAPGEQDDESAPRSPPLPSQPVLRLAAERSNVPAPSGSDGALCADGNSGTDAVCLWRGGQRGSETTVEDAEAAIPGLRLQRSCTDPWEPQ